MNIENNVVKKTNKYVYFSDGTHMSHSEHHRYKQNIRNTVAIEHQKQFGNSVLLPLEDLKLNKVEMKIGKTMPVNAMRYIILYHLEKKEYTWYFANTSTSHSSLEEEYQKIVDSGFDAISGGFYCLIDSNANLDLHGFWNQGCHLPMSNKPVLAFFGKSDSFGLRKEYFDKAMEFFPNKDRYEIVVF